MNRNRIPVALFRFGRIVATPNALSKLTHEDILAAIQRHQAGDWESLARKTRMEQSVAQNRPPPSLILPRRKRHEVLDHHRTRPFDH